MPTRGITGAKLLGFSSYIYVWVSHPYCQNNRYMTEKKLTLPACLVL